MVTPLSPSTFPTVSSTPKALTHPATPVDGGFGQLAIKLFRMMTWPSQLTAAELGASKMLRAPTVNCAKYGVLVGVVVGDVVVVVVGVVVWVVVGVVVEVDVGVVVVVSVVVGVVIVVGVVVGVVVVVGVLVAEVVGVVNSHVRNV